MIRHRTFGLPKPVCSTGSLMMPRIISYFLSYVSLPLVIIIAVYFHFSGRSRYYDISLKQLKLRPLLHYTWIDRLRLIIIGASWSISISEWAVSISLIQQIHAARYVSGFSAAWLVIISHLLPASKSVTISRKKEWSAQPASAHHFHQPLSLSSAWASLSFWHKVGHALSWLLLVKRHISLAIRRHISLRSTGKLIILLLQHRNYAMFPLRLVSNTAVIKDSLIYYSCFQRWSFRPYFSALAHWLLHADFFIYAGHCRHWAPALPVPRTWLSASCNFSSH